MSDVPPPAHVAAYVDILGVDLTVAFLLEFGGGQLNIAQNPRGSSRLAQFVGVENERAMARAAGDLPRHVPTAKPWLALVLQSKGLPVVEIARRLHSSETSVRRWLRAAGPDGPDTPDSRQMRLF